MKKAAGIFAVILGSSMLGQWNMFYLSGNIPELKTEPVYFAFHITLEVITALILIAAGIGLLKEWKWGKNLFLIGMGMVFYAMVNAAGYFAQQGKVMFIVVFAALVVAGAVITVGLLRSEK